MSGYKLQDIVSGEQIESAKKSKKPLETFVSYVPQLSAGIATFWTPQIQGLLEEALSGVRQWRQTTKLCSFSAVNDSLLMWGHYTNKHQGFCLEYDLEGLAASHTLRKKLFPVIYSNKLYDLTSWVETSMNPDRKKFNAEGPLLGLLHKFDGWQYEQEWACPLE